MSSCFAQDHRRSSSSTHAWAQEDERPNNTAICLCSINMWLLTDDSQHKQPPALGRSPFVSTVSIKRSWAMLTTWSLGILDPKDPVVLSAPAWIRRRRLYWSTVRSVWDPHISEVRHKNTGWSPKGGQPLLHSSAPEPTSPATWLSWCSVLQIWWCCHRALCRHCGPISSDSLQVVLSCPRKPGLSLQCQIKHSTSFPVL